MNTLTYTPSYDISAFWGGITDPADHDPANFRYQVHAISEEEPTNADYFRKIAEELGIGYVAGQCLDLSEDPTDFTEANTKSTTLIDPRYTTLTSAKSGLIIGVAPEDVLITSPRDVGAVHGCRRRTTELLRQEGYTADLSPEEVLMDTGEVWPNEIVVAAGDAALLGFFVQASGARRFTPGLLVPDKLEKHANRLGLPMIEIPAMDEYWPHQP